MNKKEIFLLNGFNYTGFFLTLGAKIGIIRRFTQSYTKVYG